MVDPAFNPWLVLRTRSRQECVVDSFLRERQVRSFLPKRRELRRWHDRVKTLETVLFPGYVFVQPQPEQFAIVRHVRGSCGLLMTAGKPAEIPEHAVEAVKIMAGSGEPVAVATELVHGQKVQVIAGPFERAQGEFVRIKSQQRLIINAHMIGHSVSVEVDAAHVRLL